MHFLGSQIVYSQVPSLLSGIRGLDRQPVILFFPSLSASFPLAFSQRMPLFTKNLNTCVWAGGYICSEVEHFA